MAAVAERREQIYAKNEPETAAKSNESNPAFEAVTLADSSIARSIAYEAEFEQPSFAKWKKTTALR